jgi:ectoine hydroxylase-related dioxygenase (phytanoyl-CoA dioxygenase family)
VSVAAAAGLSLAPDAVDRFAQEGFLVVRDVVDQATLRQLRDRLDDALAGSETDRMEFDGVAAGGAGRLTVLFGWWSAQADLVAEIDLSLATAAAQLLAATATRRISDESFVKPAGHGAELQWHQDYAVYADEEPAFVTAWIALDDTCVKNGALEVAVGSHLLGRFVPPQVAAGAAPCSRGLRELAAAGCTPLPDPADTDLPRRHLELRAGDCSFHHALTWHRSGANLTSEARRGAAQRWRVSA